MAVSGFHPARDAQVPSLRGWPGVADCHAGQLLLWRNGIWCRPRARRARYGGGRQAPVTKGEQQPGTTVSAFSADRRFGRKSGTGQSQRKVVHNIRFWLGTGSVPDHLRVQWRAARAIRKAPPGTRVMPLRVTPALASVGLAPCRSSDGPASLRRVRRGCHGRVFVVPVTRRADGSSRARAGAGSRRMAGRRGGARW
jgi:hypothetical protein